MALQFLDKRLIGQYIVDAWQNALDTELDPADGQWYTNGPNNSRLGLYGGLTDALATELIFDNDKKVLTPHQAVADTAIVDNRNGLTPSSTVTLSYAYSDSLSSSHSTTNALKVGVGYDLQVKYSLAGFEAQDTYKFSFEYNYSWTDATTTTHTETQTFTQVVPVNVPAGKVYQLRLLCNKEQLRIPYHADIYISGESEACFASPVNGQKIWKASAGDLCAWINQYGSAEKESYKYGRDPQDPSRGVIALQGTLTATQTTNFTAGIYDVTDSFKGTQSPSVDRTILPSSAPTPGAPMVGTIPLSK